MGPDVKLRRSAACLSITTPSVLKILLFTPNYRPDTGGIVEVSDRLFRLLNTAETEAQIVVASNVIPGRLEFSGQDRVWRAGIPSSLFYHLSLRGIVGLLARGIGILWQLFRFMSTLVPRSSCI